MPGILALPDPDHVNVVHALNRAQRYALQKWNVSIKMTFPDKYLSKPTRVTFMTISQGMVRFNPNLYANGKVCLSILGTWVGPYRSPVHTIGTVLLSILSLMNVCPYRNEPGFESQSIQLSQAI